MHISYVDICTNIRQHIYQRIGVELAVITDRIKDRLSRTALYLLFALLAIITISAALAYHHKYERRYLTEIRQQISTIADLKVSELEQFRKERLGDADVIMRNEAFSALVRRFLFDSSDTLASVQLRSWLSKLQKSGGYDCVALSDKKITVRLSIPKSRTLIDSTVLQSAAKSVESGQVVFQDFHKNEYDHRIYLNIIVPVFDRQNSQALLGFLIMRINPDTYLYPFLRRWPVPSKTAETLIVRRERERVLFLNNLRFDPKAALVRSASLNDTNLPAARAALGIEETVQGTDYRGMPVLAATRKIPNSPWSLVARMDFEEINAPLREQLWLMLLFVTITILGLAATIGLIWRQQRVQYYRERYKMSESLRDSEERFRLLFQIMVNGFALHEIILDEGGRPCDYRFTEVNPAFEAQTGLKAVDLIGHTVLEILPDTEAYWIEIYGKVALTGESIHFENYSGALDRYYEISAYSPKPGQFAALVMDITERKRAEEQIARLNVELEQRVKDRTAQMETSNTELEAFAYSVSHDLRAPLRAIDGFSRIVMEDYAGKLDDEGNRLLNIIRNNTQKMDQLITDLLLISRATRTEMQLSLIDMTAMANSVYTELASLEVVEGFDVSIRMLPKVFGDPILMKQVWSNLISNAIKYTMNKSVRRIEISGRIEDGMVVYCVKDSGAGFDPEYAHKLFGIFQRLHTTEEFEGTGIGLAIVQRIVHRHGGHVWASSELGNGATFYFALPTRGDLQ